MMSYIARHERLLSLAATGRIANGVVQNLRYQAIQASVLPTVLNLITTLSFSKEEFVIPEYNTLLLNDKRGKPRMNYANAASAMAGRLAYLMSEELRNIRDGVYPLPSEIKEARKNPIESTARTLQELLQGLSLYLGAPNYSSKATLSPGLQEFGFIEDASRSSNVPLPDYYLHDFHSVPGGFLNPKHVECNDSISEVIFTGAHRASRRMLLRPIRDELLSRTQHESEMRLLDVATGTGSFLLQVQEAFPELQLSGIDLSPAMIDHARRSFRDDSANPAHLQVANMESIPAGAGHFDIVSQTNAFHEMPGSAIERAAAEISRVLRDGGLFLHLDAVQAVDDPGSASLSKVSFDGQFQEPHMRAWMEDVGIDDIMKKAGLVLENEPRPFYASVLRCYRKVGP